MIEEIPEKILLDFQEYMVLILFLLTEFDCFGFDPEWFQNKPKQKLIEVEVYISRNQILDGKTKELFGKSGLLKPTI